MAYHIRTEKRANTLDLDGTTWILEGEGGGIEVWPALGFNCHRWFVERGGPREVLYFSPEMYEKNQTSRVGFPVLFPFPNRIRDGRFTWEGKSFQLLCNDSTKKNAIHGYACRGPWRVIDQGTSGEAAWVTGEFHAAKDFHNLKGFGTLETCWPGDHRIRLTYRLSRNRLRLEAKVDNPDSKSLPFGLGFHPYFRADLLGDSQTEVRVPADAYWELADNLPTGKLLPVEGRTDLRTWRPVGELSMDDVLTNLPSARPGQELVVRGELRSKSATLTMSTSPDFREMVMFNPPHRQAICLEPYTCTTDALNLQQQHIESGWKVLAPGQSWTGIVDMAIG